MKPATLFDSEWKLMEILWENGPTTAKEASRIAAERIGWNKNTTYTILKKLIEKGFLDRSEPDFLCTPRIDRDHARTEETSHLIDRLFDGSKKAFFSAFLDRKDLTPKEIDELRDLLEDR
jgi:BlaI family transcriptional regulator, penicillinase repressor